MKVSVSLGKAGFTPASCMKLGSDVTRIEDALVFAQFYVKNPGIKIGKNELSHISAGVHSSGGYANLVSHRAEGGMKELLLDYRKSAETANKYIRSKLEKPEVTDADRKAVVTRLEKLHGKVNEIWKMAQSDCEKARAFRPIIVIPRPKFPKVRFPK